ncbi:MAG TPA: DUF4198 domain-containing protein [Candidatus Acidoferrales bacterium]
MKNLLRIAVFLLICQDAGAHDTWLVPQTFRAQPGATVRVRLATSEAFPTSEAAAAPARIARFTIRDAAGTRQVAGYTADGTFLAADVTPSRAGHAVVVAETRPRAFVLEPEIFNRYITEEELNAVIAARAARGQSGAPGKERYRKIAKTILCAGDTGDTAYRTPEGLWLEIVPEQSTCALRVGDRLTVQVLFEGRPLPGVKLAAGYEGVTGHGYPVWLTTDANGRAVVTFDRPGAWFARTLHMIATKDDAESDWESAFSTLTFEVQPATNAAEAGVRALLAAQAGAWNRGDIEGFMAGYWRSEQLTFVTSAGVTRGWQGLLDRYRRNYADRAAMGRLTFSDLEFTVLSPDAVVVLGRWELQRAADRPAGLFTLLVRKLPEGWRVVYDHTSSFTTP